MLEREDGDGIQDRGEGHPCEGGGDGDDRLGAVGKVTADELAFELDARDEEEEGEQAVGRPLPEGEIQVQGGGGTDAGVPQAGVCRVPRRVRPGQGHDGGTEQEHAADGLGAQDVAEVSGFPFAGPA